MGDTVLAATHFVLAFLLVATLAVELTLIRPGMSADDVRTVGRVDMAYGLLFGALVLVGFGRVYFGPAGASYYFGNGWFWTKLAALGVAAALSLPPTLTLLLWRKAAKRDGTVPDAARIRGVRNWMHAEAAVLLAVPVLAVLMARG
ncbi:DUF2214 family protein [Sandaracinobacteroides saxicola]|uniref:DUF2214 family protein n=1 Tax=Sandaracinobacteroides saxicola TaxID=2759707 RepID=A0A7G5IIL6_9SPHN|nr:DUF2214 family protein [Sandaracinobacteroides saxicola]QMW23208.1 DUF2214 family protein [Sandaracinobacteroides saxicola]